MGLHERDVAGLAGKHLSDEVLAPRAMRIDRMGKPNCRTRLFWVTCHEKSVDKEVTSYLHDHFGSF